MCVEAVRRLLWEHGGEVALRDVLQLSLALDHRLIDGELASTVLTRIGPVLEEPRIELLIGLTPLRGQGATHRGLDQLRDESPGPQSPS